MLVRDLTSPIRVTFVYRFRSGLLVDAILHSRRRQTGSRQQAVRSALLHQRVELSERVARIVSPAQFGQLLANRVAAVGLIFINIREQRLKPHQQRPGVCLWVRLISESRVRGCTTGVCRSAPTPARGSIGRRRSCPEPCGYDRPEQVAIVCLREHWTGVSRRSRRTCVGFFRKRARTEQRQRQPGSVLFGEQIFWLQFLNQAVSELCSRLGVLLLKLPEHL